MEFTKLPTTPSERPLFSSRFPFADTLTPCLHKDTLAQTHYVFSASRPAAVSLQVKLTGAEESCKADFEYARDKWSVAENAYPYGLSEAQWWGYYTQSIESYGADCCFTGHLGRFVFPQRNK
jgi:hypothetical protein